jgi:hypothetical protein
MDLPTEPDAILEWLIGQGLGDYPAIFVYRGSGLMLASSYGAKHDVTAKDRIRNKPPIATLAEVGDALRLVHTERLVTPSGCPEGVWARERAAEYVPGPEPEKAIQKEVVKWLYSWFRGVLRPYVEEPIPPGRIDVRLLQQQADGRWVYWAIIELKVVRSSHHAEKGKEATPVSAADNADAVAEGVRQAYAFAAYWNVEGLLEIFDLRKSKAVDVLREETVVAELAKCSQAPSCRVWQLFGSASDARLSGFF